MASLAGLVVPFRRRAPHDTEPSPGFPELLGPEVSGGPPRNRFTRETAPERLPSANAHQVVLALYGVRNALITLALVVVVFGVLALLVSRPP